MTEKHNAQRRDMKWWQIQEKNFYTVAIFAFPIFILLMKKILESREHRNFVKDLFAPAEPIYIFLGMNFDALIAFSPVWLFLFAVPVNLWIRKKPSDKRILLLVIVGFFFSIFYSCFFSHFGWIAVPFVYLQFLFDILLLWIGMKVLRQINVIIDDMEHKVT